MSFFDDVREFHTAFSLPVGDKPRLPADIEEQFLRLRLIDEEFRELRLAHVEKNLVSIAQELGDLIYVVCGMAVAYGIPLNEVFAELHRANMTKMGEDGPIYREDGKVLKPEGWQPPDIKGVLEGRIRKLLVIPRELFDGPS